MSHDHVEVVVEGCSNIKKIREQLDRLSRNSPEKLTFILGVYDRRILVDIGQILGVLEDGVSIFQIYLGKCRILACTPRYHGPPLRGWCLAVGIKERIGVGQPFFRACPTT